MPGVFTDFASSRFLSRDRVVSQLRAVVEALKSERTDVEEIHLFGSFASGVPTPKSDIDLLIVTEASAETLLPHFFSIPLPVDIHAIRPEIFRKKKLAGKGLVKEALNKGIRLL